jgi:hypothetical protein
MSTILYLQRLTPTISRGEMNVMFMSSGSAVCPTTAAGDEFRQFELD